MSGRPKNWAWKHYIKLDSSFIKCSLCKKIYKSVSIHPIMKTHLKEHHKIRNEDDRNWRERKIENSAWEYFTREENYFAKCKICNYLIQNAYSANNIEQHLILRHPTEIRIKQEKIKSTWLSQHFAFDAQLHEARCIYCVDKYLKIFVGIDGLEKHLFENHKNKYSRTHTSTESYKNDVMIQQLVSEENNANTSSYQAGTYSQVTENLEGQQRLLSSLISGNSSEDFEIDVEN